MVEVKNNPHDRAGVSMFHFIQFGGITMPLLPLATAGKQLGISKQALAYYHNAGKITGVQSGPYFLVDPEVTRAELEKLGYYRRNELRRSRKIEKSEV